MGVTADFRLNEDFADCRRIVCSLCVVLLVCLTAACNAPTEAVMKAKGKAKQTPQERYFDQVYGLVHKKWDLYRAQSPNDRAQGALKVLFYVGPEGRVEQIRVKNNEHTDPVLTKFTVKAIQDAKLPPMPTEVIPLLKHEPEMGMEFGMSINLKPKAEGGRTASGGPLITAETRKQMEKRWGAALTRGDEVSVSLTASEGGSASGGAKTTVKLTQTPLGCYRERVVQAVEKKWNKYRRMEMAGVTYGSLDLVFYVNKKGGVEDVRVVDERQSYRALTLFTLQAIRDAEIPPMPADVIPLLPKKDRGRLKIEYHVLIY